MKLIVGKFNHPDVHPELMPSNAMKLILDFLQIFIYEISKNILMLIIIFFFMLAELFQELVAVLVLVQDHFCRWTKRFHLKQNLILIESNF